MPCSRRCSPTCSRSAATSKEAVIPAAELTERFHIPPDQLEEHLSLLNLVNFGGGCYAVYAELQDDEVHVDKELYGDTFRRPPRLTPLEARAIRLALEYVGPSIAADAHSPLERVRRKLEETFGEFDDRQTASPHAPAGADFVAILSDAILRRRLVRLEYLKEGETTPSARIVEPYKLERKLPDWYVHTWSRTSDGERSFRLDRVRNAELLKEKFEPREGFEPREFQGARTVTLWYSPAVARWAVERGARPLADGSAVEQRPAGGLEWLAGEVLQYRGEAVVVEPADLRKHVAQRTRELARELHVRPRARVKA